ncbi:tape measure protein, partial [Conchiformibius steedae]|uniref:tape measure protein n=1 Tax=Conchiformibius steedae TaxID=153493 RepID=UPI0026EF8568
MAADISATVGLDGSGFHSEINRMAGASKRFARSLESQFAQLQGGQAGLDRYRASLLNMSAAQQQVVENLIKRNDAERQRQAADKLAQAQAAQRQAAINGTISALQREAAAIGKTAEQLQLLELRSQGASIAQLAQARAAQKSLAAARAQQENRQAIDGIIGALQREAAAIGKTAEQLQLLELRSKGATQAQIAQAEALQQATAKHQSDQKRKQAVDGLVASINREAAAIGKTNAELKIMELRSNGATQAQIRQARQTLALTEAHNRLQAAQSRSSPLGSAAGAAAAVGGTAGIIQQADAWTTLQNRLKLVHGTQAQVAAAQQGIIGIARQTGQSLSEVGTVYQRFAANQKALNLNGKELVEVTDIVAKAVSNGGSTAEGAAAALNQFGQAMASGVLRGEEFNSVMEQAPGLAQALAAGLGVSIGQLRSLANNGELSAQKVVKALQKAGDGVRADFAKTDLTIAQSFTVLQNKLTEFVGQTGESSGAIKVFSSTLRFLGDNIDSVATVVGGLAALSLTRWAITSAAGLVQMTAAMVATSGAAGTATAAQTALSVAVARTGTASALASFQVRGFAGSLAVLRVGAVATAGALWALPAAAVQGGFTLLAKGAAVAGGALTAMSARIGAAGTVGKLGAIGTAAAAAGTGLYSLYKFAKGEDASNWISDSVDKLFGLDTQVESLGT